MVRVLPSDGSIVQHVTNKSQIETVRYQGTGTHQLVPSRVILEPCP